MSFARLPELLLLGFAIKRQSFLCAGGEARAEGNEANIISADVDGSALRSAQIVGGNNAASPQKLEFQW